MQEEISVEKSRGPFRYLAGAFFLVLAGWQVYQMISRLYWQDTYTIVWAAVQIMGLLFLSTGMFASIRGLAAAGSAMEAVNCGRSFIPVVISVINAGHSIFDSYVLCRIGTAFLALLSFLFLLFAALAKKKSLLWAILACVMMILEELLYLLVLKYGISVISAVYLLVMIAAMLMLGLAFSPAHMALRTASGFPPAAAGPQDNRIERITRLKTLLDQGILTREEFEMQKQRILHS